LAIIADQCGFQIGEISEFGDGGLRNVDSCYIPSIPLPSASPIVAIRIATLESKMQSEIQESNLKSEI
jgi:hypothetical protein